MKIWQRGSPTHNPYYRNAFRLARVPREVTRPRNLVELIGQTKRIIMTDPLAHQIAGQPVSLADLTEAEQILPDPKQRILEELLVHATEQPSQKPLREQAARVEGLLLAGADQPLPLRDPGVLAPLVPAVTGLFLEASPAPQASLGALELDLIGCISNSGRI